jgi:hypothetical protein
VGPLTEPVDTKCYQPQFSSGTRLGAATGELMMSRSHLSCSSIS